MDVARKYNWKLDLECNGVRKFSQSLVRSQLNAMHGLDSLPYISGLSALNLIKYVAYCQYKIMNDVELHVVPYKVLTIFD